MNNISIKEYKNLEKADSVTNTVQDFVKMSLDFKVNYKTILSYLDTYHKG